jgi:hypothetical protein
LTIHQIATVYIGELSATRELFEKKIIGYIVDRGLSRSGARHHALVQTIGNARGLDINSPLSAKAHTQDLRFHRHH